MQFIKEKINMTFTYENYLLRAGTELSTDQGGLKPPDLMKFS